MRVLWLPGAGSVPVGPRSDLADPLGVSSQGQQCGESTLAILGLWAPLCLVGVLPWSKKEPWRLLTPWTLLPTAILVRPRGVKGSLLSEAVFSQNMVGRCTEGTWLRSVVGTAQSPSPLPSMEGELCSPLLYYQPVSLG